MRNLLLFGLLVVSANKSLGQKIQGVYVGKLFSERNVLVLEADKSNRVKGNVYVSEKLYFDFIGDYIMPRLKGFILLNDGKKISVDGTLNEDFLTATLADSSKEEVTSLHKISFGTGVKMNYLFSGQHDMLLVGHWESFKEIDASGKDVTFGTGIFEFSLSGGCTSWWVGVPPNVSARDLKGYADFRIKNDWETYDGKLTQKSQRFGVEISGSMNYVVRNDTLVLKTVSSRLIYFARKIPR